MEPIKKSFIKVFLFLFCFFFAISGLGILIAGSVVIHDTSDYGHFIDGKITAPPIILIVLGILILVIATLGCYGALKESPKYLMAFAVLLLIVFIVELSIGIAACVFKSDLKMVLDKQLEKSMYRRNSDDMMAWNRVQMNLKCCGMDGPKNWYDNNNRTIPASCCRPHLIDPQTNDCLNAPPLFMDRYYQDGCMTKLHDKFAGNTSILIGVGLGIAFIQILGIILAFWLASAIKRENNN